MAPRVLILGSCVSRDILNFAEQGSITLADYFARSSIASIASEPYHLDDRHYARIASDFQRRMVRRDVEKTLLRDLAGRQDVDFILIDLIDERFDLYEVSPGSVVTVSSEFLMTGLVTAEDRASERWIRSGSERHRALWKSGVKRLFAALAEYGIADRIVINRVFWADRLVDGTPLPEKESPQREAANSLLAWMYEELEQYVPAPRWMSFPEHVLRSNPDHRWGIAPFHYSDDYYADALAGLAKLHADARRDGATLLGNGRLLAWSGRLAGAVRRSCFLVFRDKRLVHRQPYAAAREMQFDTGHARGEYEVVLLTLTFDPAEPGPQPVARTETKFVFHINQIQE